MTILSVPGESRAAWTSLLYRQPSAPPAAPAGAQAAEQKLGAKQLRSHESCPKVSSCEGQAAARPRHTAVCLPDRLAAAPSTARSQDKTQQVCLTPKTLEAEK